MKITILASPKGKSRPRTVSKGGRTWTYTPSSTTHLENLIRDKVAECAEYFDADVPIKLEATFYLEKPKSVSKKRIYPAVRPDFDNLAKLLTDSLEKFVYKNDAQIVDCYIKKRYGFPPRIEVSVEKLE